MNLDLLVNSVNQEEDKQKLSREKRVSLKPLIFAFTGDISERLKSIVHSMPFQDIFDSISND